MHFILRVLSLLKSICIEYITFLYTQLSVYGEYKMYFYCPVIKLKQAIREKMRYYMNEVYPKKRS